MPEPADHELLAEFARSGSETAFAALVARYMSLVHSTAFRFAGNSHHAEEITQAVFIILARKSGRLSPRVVLSGWLYQTARLVAANFTKAENRRQRREQEVYMQSSLNETESVAWEKIAPRLDEAMGGLGETDRNAVVLHYFENKSAAEIGTALRMNEETARKRVNRALEKLRKIFTKRGIVIPAAVLSAAISANSVQAAPAALAKTISAVAVAKGGAATASTLTLVKGALKLMAWTKVKMAVATGACVLIVAGTATVIVKHQHETSPLGFFFKNAINEAVDDMFTFPELTNNVPVGGATKVRSLLSWVVNDATNFPGKSFHQLSYSAVIGTGEGYTDTDENDAQPDLEDVYLLTNGNRTALATLMVRPNFETSTRAFLVATYHGGGQLLDRKIILQWSDKQSKWLPLRSAGPSPEKIRD